MEPAFIHVRKHYWATGFDTASSPVPISSTGGATIGYIVDGNLIMFAVARCSEQDTYCRRIGRLICEGRLKKGKAKSIPLPKEANRGEIRAALLSQLNVSS